MGPFQYEPIAVVQLGVVDYLFAPLNALLGLALAVLVGLNLAVAYARGGSQPPVACPNRGGPRERPDCLPGSLRCCRGPSAVGR